MRYLLTLFTYLFVSFAAIANEPDLSMFNTRTQLDIKGQCSSIKYNDGIIPFYKCLEENKSEILLYGGTPDLSMFDTRTQLDIKGQCSSIKYNDGIIPFYNCLKEEAKKIEEYANLSTDDLLIEHICNSDQPIEFLREKALEFYNQEKLKDTFTCSLAGAKLNDPYSNGITGWHFQFGIGTDQDLEEANKWYQKGVALGDNYSKVNLAKNLTEGIGIAINKKKAFELVKEAAETGYTVAEADLGFHYLQSIGTPANYELAFKYFKLAAEKNNIFAQSRLGWMYAGGRGTELDYDLGFYWTKMAADQNDDYALANLGWHYQLGLGVQKNIELAKKYYLRASNQGNEYAKNQLILIENDINNKSIDDTKNQKIIVAKNKTEQKSSNKNKLVGSYEGHAIFDGYEYPVSIELSIDANNSIVGSYKSNNDFGGILYNGTLYNDRILKIYWREGSDRGWMEYVFDETYTNVQGKWGFIIDDEEQVQSGLYYLESNDKKDTIYEDFGNYYALVIGNNKYQHWSKLDSAINDAKKIGQILASKFNFNVTSLINANRDEIMNAIFDMRENLTANDNLLIYFAGHGELDKEADRGYWIPVDGDIKNPTKWISNQYIIDQLKASKAKHIMVIADSCFSASLLRGNQEVNASNSLNQLSKMKTRVILTSGGLGPVFDGGGENNHSVFASVLINALLNQNEPFVTGEIFPQIREYVQNNVEAMFVCDDKGDCEEDYQTPEFSVLGKTGHAGGDFIFIPN